MRMASSLYQVQPAWTGWRLAKKSIPHLTETAKSLSAKPRSLDGRDVLIEQGDVGQRLARLLGCDQVVTVRQGDRLSWCAPHNHEVDGLLVELTDLFISIRYARPTLVQLGLVLHPAPHCPAVARVSGL